MILGPNAIIVGGQTTEGVTTDSIRANIAPEAPFFQLGLFGATVPALKIDGEIGQQLGYLNANTVGVVDFAIFIAIGVIMAHRTQIKEWRDRRSPREGAPGPGLHQPRQVALAGVGRPGRTGSPSRSRRASRPDVPDVGPAARSGTRRAHRARCRHGRSSAAAGPSEAPRSAHEGEIGMRTAPSIRTVAYSSSSRTSTSSGPRLSAAALGRRGVARRDRRDRRGGSSSGRPLRSGGGSPAGVAGSAGPRPPLVDGCDQQRQVQAGPAAPPRCRRPGRGAPAPRRGSWPPRAGCAARRGRMRRPA